MGSRIHANPFYFALESAIYTLLHFFSAEVSYFPARGGNSSPLSYDCKRFCYHAPDYKDERFPANVPEGFLDYKLLINDCKSYHIFRKKPQQSSKALYSIIVAVRKRGMEILLS